MDALDEIVVAKQRELEDLLRKVEKLEVEVKALTKAASLRPAPAKAWDEAPLRSRARAKTAKLKGRVGGKEPGTISNSWRDTLLFIDMLAAPIHDGVVRGPILDRGERHRLVF